MELRFPLILDGATGTELQKRGYTGDVCAEQWTLEHPEAIIDIQRGYVDSGSQVLYTPTFGANRRKLEEHGIFNRTEDYNRRLAALSEQAANGKALRAGDISPTGAFLAPLGDVSFEELVDIYTEQAAGLERAGVDLFVIETMSDIIQVGYFKMTHKRVFKMAPIHHHFELKGWPEVKVVVRFWMIEMLFVLIALVLFYGDWVARSGL